MSRRRPRSVTAKRREALIVRVTRILDQHNQTWFEFEGACRHHVRSELCLEGWRWHHADALAAEVLEAALGRLGAQRPSWQEGQPLYAQQGYVLFKRTRCVRCGWQIPTDDPRATFCSTACQAAEYRERHREHMRAYDYARQLKRRSRHECIYCGRPFERYAERKLQPKYCSQACSHRHRREHLQQFHRPPRTDY